jgi:hypothetical protein
MKLIKIKMYMVIILCDNCVCFVLNYYVMILNKI